MKPKIYQRIFQKHLVLLVIAIILSLFVSYNLAIYQDNQHHREELEHLVGDMEIIIGNYIESGDRQALKDDLVTYFTWHKTVEQVKFYDLRGVRNFYATPERLILTEERGVQRRDLNPETILTKKDDEIRFKTNSVLKMDNKAVGTFEIEGIIRHQSHLFSDFNKYFASILIIVIIFSVFGSYFLIKKILKPLNQLINYCNEFKIGNYEANIEIDNNDEIGELAGVINEMSGKLAQKMREMEVINLKLEEKIAVLTTVQDVNKIMSSNIYFDEVYDTITRAICEFAPETVSCSLWLMDQNRRGIYRKSIYTEDPSFPIDYLTPVARKIVQNVVYSQIPEIIEDFKDDFRFSEYDDYLIQYAVMCINLTVKKQTVGAICVWKKKKPNEQNFGNADVEMLLTIADQASLAIEINNLLGKMVENEKTEKELELARKIQEDFMSDILPSVDYASIDACSVAANKAVGGDYFDVIKLANGDLIFAISDVMGKGIPAAIFMAVTRITLKTVLKSEVMPDKILENINNILHNDLGKAKKFVTMFCALYRYDKHELLFANAGHWCPFLYRASSGECFQLSAKGPFLGGIRDRQYDLEKTVLEKGDIVFFYTDGLKEAANGKGKEFGVEKIKEVIIRNCNLDAEGIKGALLNEVSDFIQGYPQSDDLTFIVFKITA